MGVLVLEAEESVRVPAQTALVRKKKAKCPCQGCQCNINSTYVVDYDDPDVEIGCKARQRLSRGKLFVPVKPAEITKTGCKYRSKA